MERRKVVDLSRRFSCNLRWVMYRFNLFRL